MLNLIRSETVSNIEDTLNCRALTLSGEDTGADVLLTTFGVLEVTVRSKKSRLFRGFRLADSSAVKTWREAMATLKRAAPGQVMVAVSGVKNLK